jgi:hypothetical protein
MPLVQQFTYPTSVELEQIESVKLPRLTTDSPIFGLFPFQGRRTHLLEWTQKDNYGGMQQIRGLNGMPASVARVGQKSFIMKPGVYGEFSAVDEMELTTRAAMGRPNVPISLDELVTEIQDQLLTRRLNRIEWLCWQVVVNGHFVTLDHKGAVRHTDQFDVQTYTSIASIEDPAAGTPLQNFIDISDMGRGMSTSFGGGATCYVNQTTATRIMSNRNANDLWGIKLGGGNSPLGIDDVNTILSRKGLPRVVVYDEGYFDETGTFINYIPDNVGIVIGRRQSGAPLGAFRFVINVNNAGGTPAPYTRVIDHFDRRIPRLVEVHDGFSGGPVLYFPGSILKMKFGTVV